MNLGKHITYQSSMGSGCSFPELADTLLVLGECIRNTTDAVRRYRKKYPNRRVPAHCTALSVNHWLKERGTFHWTQWAIHILYILYAWKSRSSVVERQSAISPRCLAGCTLTPCLCILYVTRSEIVSVSCSDCVRVSTTQYTSGMGILSTYFATAGWHPYI
jgi:hypothetical protein